MTASMTTIDLIIKPRTELLEPVTTLFKLAAPSISSCALSIYFSQFLPLLLFSSYPLPTLTMDHIQCLSQELKKVRHMSHQAEKGETCLTKLRHMSHQTETHVSPS